MGTVENTEGLDPLSWREITWKICKGTQIPHRREAGSPADSDKEMGTRKLPFRPDLFNSLNKLATPPWQELSESSWILAEILVLSCET